MNYKQKKDFVDWLGVMYLDFDNESFHNWYSENEVDCHLELHQMIFHVRNYYKNSSFIGLCVFRFIVIIIKNTYYNVV